MAIVKKILSRPKKIGIKIRSLHETYKTITTIEKKLTALKRLARVKKAAARLRAVKSARGRPKKSVTKQRVDMRFDPDVINGLKSHFGRGWSTKVNDEMRKLLVKSKVL